MKNITKAMNETEFKPRAKWWGFVKDGKRFLMRYNHTFTVFSDTEVLFSYYETKTDKAGVEFAIKYFNEKLEASKKQKNRMINHPYIKEGSVVKYDGEDYKVKKVWNHGYLQWWLDLIAVNPIMDEVNYYREHMSVPSYNVDSELNEKENHNEPIR